MLRQWLPNDTYIHHHMCRATINMHIGQHPPLQVISRSGDECVVALTDQWYMTYGEEKWQAETLEALKALNTYSDESRHQFEHTMGECSATTEVPARSNCNART